MKQKLQLMELFAELDAQEIAEQAEKRFAERAIRSLRFSERLTSLIPVFIVIVWLGAYAISAPHTATLFKLISPTVQFIIPFSSQIVDLTGLAPALAPLVIEGFVTLIAALQENERSRLETSIALDASGRRKKIKTRYDGYLFWLMTLLVSVNVLGALVAIYQVFIIGDTSIAAADPASAALVASTVEFNPFDMGWFFIAIIAGVLIPFIALLTGRVLAESANGKTTLEVKASAGFYGIAKYNALKQAFLNEALKVASPSNAAKYAERMAYQMSKDELYRLEDGTLQEKSRSASDESYPLVDATASEYLSQGESRQLATVNASVATGKRDRDSREIGFIKSAQLHSSATGQARKNDNDRHDSASRDSLSRQLATDATAAEFKIIDVQAARAYIEQHPSRFAACNRASEYLDVLQQNGMSASLRTIQRALKAMQTSAGDER